MRVRTSGAGTVLVVAVMACASMIPERAQEKAQSTSRTVAARDGRAEIDARAAEWLKVSNVPSLAVANIENGKVA